MPTPIAKTREQTAGAWNALSWRRLDELPFAGRRLLRRTTVQRSLFIDDEFDAESATAIRDISLAGRTAGQGPRVAFVHGVMPRSGTNFVHSLLSLHPQVEIYPLGMKEAPLLLLTSDMEHLQRRFFLTYRNNAKVMVDHEMMAYLVKGFMHRVQATYPSDRLVLIKSPHARMLQYFPYLFPLEQAVVVLREGRRVVQSTLDTWPPGRLGRTFEDICLEWSWGTEAALRAEAEIGSPMIRLVRYEKAVAEPAETVSELLKALDMPLDEYPFDRIDSLPVLGSSQISRSEDGVTWAPVRKPRGFDPAGRAVTWTCRQQASFERIAGEMQKRAGY